MCVRVEVLVFMCESARASACVCVWKCEKAWSGSACVHVRACACSCSCVDINAPGSAITSAVSTGDTATATWSGTSMATPHVAGAVALLLSDNPSATADAIEGFLLTAATSGALSGLGSSPNKLLFVGNLFTPGPTVVGSTNPPTSLPPTAAPSTGPTRSPTRAPTTRTPIAARTRAPVTAAPTRAPIVALTRAPTRAPTRARAG
jgi:subtilisin family serine protease